MTIDYDSPCIDSLIEMADVIDDWSLPRCKRHILGEALNELRIVHFMLARSRRPPAYDYHSPVHRSCWVAR